MRIEKQTMKVYKMNEKAGTITLTFDNDGDSAYTFLDVIPRKPKDGGFIDIDLDGGPLVVKWKKEWSDGKTEVKYILDENEVYTVKEISFRYIPDEAVNELSLSLEISYQYK